MITKIIAKQIISGLNELNHNEKSSLRRLIDQNIINLDSIFDENDCIAEVQVLRDVISDNATGKFIIDMLFIMKQFLN